MLHRVTGSSSTFSIARKLLHPRRHVPLFHARQRRSLITVGTDMTSSVISLQKARPWYMSTKEGSNLAAENAVTMKDLFQARTVVFFGVPAPFTGTCTQEHYPGYKKAAEAFQAAGVDGTSDVCCTCRRTACFLFVHPLALTKPSVFFFILQKLCVTVSPTRTRIMVGVVPCTMMILVLPFWPIRIVNLHKPMVSRLCMTRSV